MAQVDEHQQYLANQILARNQTVTYRVLSRALKIHVNTAKQMLLEYQKWQNGREPDSIRATYLIYGIKRDAQDEPKEGADFEIVSSRPEAELEHLSDAVHTSTLTLVAEENVEEALAAYQQISSFHAYSVASHPCRDLQLLSDVHCQLHTQTQGLDTLDAPTTYGTIGNPKASKRSRQSRQLVVSAPAPPMFSGQQAAPGKPSSKTPVISETEEAKDFSTKATSSIASDTKSPSSTNRRSSGTLMQSFAKATARGPYRPESKREASPKQEETRIYAMSDDGGNDDFPATPRPPQNGEAKRSLKERQAQLRRMMDEEEGDAKKEDTPDEGTAMEKSSIEPSQELPHIDKKQSELGDEVFSPADGRRRGRRRVMKKKQVEDEDGYLVTVQEAAWESFSEDEGLASSIPQKKAKTSAATPSSSATSEKTNRTTGKAQGNIMAFFAKK